MSCLGACLILRIMAIEIKRKAPRAHTVLELVRRRWGHVANWVRKPQLPILRVLSWITAPVCRLAAHGEALVWRALPSTPDTAICSCCLCVVSVWVHAMHAPHKLSGPLLCQYDGGPSHPAPSDPPACHSGQVFFYICFLNNTFICVLLFLGAGSVFNAATSAQPLHCVFGIDTDPYCQTCALHW